MTSLATKLVVSICTVLAICGDLNAQDQPPKYDPAITSAKIDKLSDCAASFLMLSMVVNNPKVQSSALILALYDEAYMQKLETDAGRDYRDNCKNLYSAAYELFHQAPRDFLKRAAGIKPAEPKRPQPFAPSDLK